MRNNEALRYPRIIRGKRHSMTLVVVLGCKDGIVFASDTQATEILDPRYAVKKVTPKVKQIGKYKLVCGCGTLSLIQEIIRQINYLSQEILDTPLADEKFYKQACKVSEGVRKEELERFERLHGSQTQLKLEEAQIIIGEYRDREPLIFQISEEGRGVFVESGYGCYGNPLAAMIANTLIRHYETTKIEVKHGVVLAYKAIKFAIDTGLSPIIGEPIDIWTITDEGIKQRTKSEIEDLRKKYQTWITEF